MRLAGAGLLLCALVAGCGSGHGEEEQARREEPPARSEWTVPEEAKQRDNPVEPTEASVKQGKMLYRGHCYICHGREGKGDGPWVEQLPKEPADLTAPETMRKMSDGELFWKITRGRALMPGFEHQLSPKQRWHVVNYLRALARQREED